jgi:hypothetical protein
MMRVAILQPGFDLFDDRGLIRNASIQTLRSQDAELGFGQIEPASVLWRVMPLEAFDQPSRLRGGKRLVERGGAMGVEIVLDQNDLPSAGKVCVGQILEDVGVVDGGAAVGDLDPGLRRGRL